MEILKLNETIGFYRKKLGMTQEELACALGVTNQSVSKWESAQCCPDIGLIPRLAELFDISIDALFGRESVPNTVCTQLPFEDDDVIRVIVARGYNILNAEDVDKPIHIRFPENCNEETRQYFSVEVFGNIECDDVCGDVSSHGNIECKDVCGDVRQCHSIACKGDILGDVRQCHTIACSGDICGDINCEGKVVCGGCIEGDVQCSANLFCGSISGDVDCQGDIIYK